MPSWWGKFSSKDGNKKVDKESFINTLNRKFRILSEEKSSNRSDGLRRRCSDSISERGFQTPVPVSSPSTSTLVSRCQSFADRPHAQPLPLPGGDLATIGCTDSGLTRLTKPEFDKDGKQMLFLPLPKPSQVDNGDAEVDIATASVSSDSSIDSDDPSDSRLLSPLTSDYENGSKTAMSSPMSIKHKDQSAIGLKNTIETLKPVNLSRNIQDTQIPPTSPKRRPLCNHMQNLQIPPRGVLSSAPESSISSPSRSPMRSFCIEPVFSGGKTFSDAALLGSGQCSSPGSGFNSGHNSIGGDMSGQLLWPQSRCSPECSPVPSPRMTSPGPSSRIHSGGVTPLHPRAGGPNNESPITRPEDGRQSSHRLPVPPLTISNTCPFSPNYSTVTSPSVPRSPARAEMPASPGSRWKKGRLLGRGTFGQVYQGFDSESGEMCAMKEVTLFPDDPKSKESAQQLNQEISLLSRLRHPNIVRYYGSETIGDKLYIYLEFVSGGSIYKLLQEYGQFGENAIRIYTQQILSGLAYLHAKNTLHRDIKGANILVDPSGRVKLADFGMAKHITGQYCPLSFKGSPYWMAPEVIKNASGCNLAVDIWSLGCTVFEMATTKPPWSQYEGVAAMFKIGNSKELPEIPAHLSEDGKDFVRRCLRRDPSLRPTAAQLLEHPFVKNAAPLERPILSAEPSETTSAGATNSIRTMVGSARNFSCFDCEDRTNHHSKGVKIGVGSSASHTPRNMSCQISPIGSPILRSRSPQSTSGRMSPSPISTPLTASGSSTPLTGGNGAIPFHPQQHPVIGAIPRSPNNFYGLNLYQEHNTDISRGRSQPAHVFREMISSDNSFNRPSQPVLADHVSQQLLSEHLNLKQSTEPKPNSSARGRANGI